MSAANVLLQAIFAKLSGDAALMALIPGGIVDRLLPRAILPLIVIGELESRDYSTATEKAEEHFLSLDIWSDANGRRCAGEIAGRVKTLLDDAAPSACRYLARQSAASLEPFAARAEDTELPRRNAFQGGNGIGSVQEFCLRTVRQSTISSRNEMLISTAAMVSMAATPPRSSASVKMTGATAMARFCGREIRAA